MPNVSANLIAGRTQAAGLDGPSSGIIQVNPLEDTNSVSPGTVSSGSSWKDDLKDLMIQDVKDAQASHSPSISEAPDISEDANDSGVQNDVPGLGEDKHYDDADPIENEGGFSLAQYMQENPGLSYEDYMRVAAAYSDEYAEKYLDYLTERGELDKANAYTAQREDTAYQRLVEDLKKAGLNPAMMYGSSASTSASGSQGYVKMTEGANSRAVGNYSKLRNLILAYMGYELKRSLGITNSVIKGVNSLTGLLSS